MTIVTVTAEVDLEEVIMADPAETVLKVFGRLGLPLYQKEAAIEAIGHIRRGDLVDAITILERTFLPKWSDKSDAEAAFKAHGGAA
ncbi:hypothetical protein [Aureimonas ureilytica]|uniref:hypothetical protein n=1 Tax=Aureimonas ureilytica TaxID=401562 RepID=UPI0003708D86|nr:hypothetical protein [Aureimonas ureilytica]